MNEAQRLALRLEYVFPYLLEHGARCLGVSANFLETARALALTLTSVVEKAIVMRI